MGHSFVSSLRFWCEEARMLWCVNVILNYISMHAMHSIFVAARLDSAAHDPLNFA